MLGVMTDGRKDLCSFRPQGEIPLERWCLPGGFLTLLSSHIEMTVWTACLPGGFLPDGRQVSRSYRRVSK